MKVWPPMQVLQKAATMLTQKKGTQHTGKIVVGSKCESVSLVRWKIDKPASSRVCMWRDMCARGEAKAAFMARERFFFGKVETPLGNFLLCVECSI